MSDSIKKDAIKNDTVKSDVKLGSQSNRVTHNSLKKDASGTIYNEHPHIKKYVVPVTSALLLLFLSIVFIVNFFHESRVNNVSSIVHDLNTLAHVFETIDKTCDIIGFDYQKNSINFLNVISFAGSEVGSMNLRHPEKWEGPYLKDNLSFQHKEYQVVKTNSGYFITPGDGVKLPNGKVVGVDIKLDNNTDIASLMYQKEAFLVDNHSLAIALPLSSHFMLEK